jgi:hypothetical protein
MLPPHPFLRAICNDDTSAANSKQVHFMDGISAGKQLLVHEYGRWTDVLG